MHEANLMRDMMTGTPFPRELALSAAVEQGVLSTTAVWNGGRGHISHLVEDLRINAARYRVRG